MRSEIVEFWSKFFLVLRWFSVWELLKKLRPTLDTVRNVEYYVSVNFLSSICLFFLSSFADVDWLEWFAFGWAVIRVFEAVVYQINVLLFDVYRARRAGKKLEVAGFLRLLVLLIMNYIEIIFWFAIIYCNLHWLLTPCGIHFTSFIAPLNFSFVTMTTFGYTIVSPESVWEIMVTLTQSAIGLFMALLMLARFVSLLPEPKEESEEMVQHPKAASEQTFSATGTSSNMEEPKHVKLLPFLLSTYGCSGLFITLLRNGIWNEFSGQGLGIIESLQYGAFFVAILFLLLFSNIYVSMKLSSRYQNSDVIFGSISFFIVLTFTEVALRPPVSQYTSWITILEGVLPGGIVGWSHALLIGFVKLKQELSVKVKDLESSNWDGKRIFSRALELEHSFLQTIVNWVLWATLVFLTAGLTAYFIQQMDDPNLGIRITTSMPMIVWGVLGICFGIVMPINSMMKYIRQELARLSYSKVASE